MERKEFSCLSLNVSLLFFSFLKILFIYFLERGKVRERNNDVREKHWSVVSQMCPDQGLNL